MTHNMPHGRAALERVRIDHRNLTATEVFHLRCVLCGWHVAPRTPADRPPIGNRSVGVYVGVIGGRQAGRRGGFASRSVWLRRRRAVQNRRGALVRTGSDGTPLGR
jgi:hypothetical protein